MNCKYCGTELEEGASICPACGAAQEEPAEQILTETAAAEETIAEEVSEEAIEAAEERTGDAQAAPEAAKEKKKKNVSNGIMIGIIVVLLAVIAAVIVMIVNARKPKEAEAPAAQSATQQTESPSAEAPAEGEETPAGNGISYTVTEEEMTEELLDKVVATVGSEELTNRQLGIYYWEQYYSFANNFGSYLSMLMDTTLGLDKQMYSDEETWQQAFLNQAVECFSNVASVLQAGKEDGYELPESDQAYVDSIADTLQATVTAYGFENADEYLKFFFGPGVTLEEYQKFVGDSYFASSYLDSLVDAEPHTKDDISAYYDENAETYEMYGVQKVDKPSITIRHVLVMPEGEQDENGEYSEQAWADAEQKIQEILAEYEAGEKTEDAFSELAMAYSYDSNASSGGIYTDVYPGQMVETFNDWCFADGRQPGDYGLVKTEYGWHLIYFCEEGEEIYWYTLAESDYLNERAIAIQEELSKKYNASVSLSNAAIVDVLAAQEQ